MLEITLPAMRQLQRCQPARANHFHAARSPRDYRWAKLLNKEINALFPRIQSGGGVFTQRLRLFSFCDGCCSHESRIQPQQIFVKYFAVGVLTNICCKCTIDP